MPIYEYQCETCGRAEELLQNLGAPERHDCACGAPLGMARQLSVPALGGQQDSAPAQAPCPSAGGGCGGACPFSQ